jgi:ketosteroid isomerase-like protein
MSQGGARNLLVKALLRELLSFKFGSECFRCGDQITPDEEFHIDHKISWEHHEKPLETYLDVTNVAFSHSSCNVAVAKYGARRLSASERALSYWRKKQRRKFKQLFNPE